MEAPSWWPGSPPFAVGAAGCSSALPPPPPPAAAQPLASSAASSWPAWLQRTAERRAKARAHVPEHVTERRETCQVETVDGFKVLRCTETRELLRKCADGQREVIEHSTTTTVRPYEPCSSTAQASSSSSRSRYEEAVSGPLAPMVSATLGQMLDDFFAYAAELQESLEQQGVDVSAAADRSWLSGMPRPSGGGSGSEAPGSRSGGSPGLFGWWQRRRSAAPAAQGAQPTLQQLVRESNSDVLEL